MANVMTPTGRQAYSIFGQAGGIVRLAALHQLKMINLPLRTPTRCHGEKLLNRFGAGCAKTILTDRGRTIWLSVGAGRCNCNEVDSGEECRRARREPSFLSHERL